MHTSSFTKELVGAVLLAISIFPFVVSAFSNTVYDNVAVYWGQNSLGAANASDTAGYQKTLAYYCQDDAIDAIPIAFLDVFFGTGGLPEINLANTCNTVDNATFPGTALLNCAALASDIEYCQSQGKIVTISLGGATGSVGFANDTQAQTFAETIWNLFLGGTSSTRPFGSAVLDGVDLDIEGGSSTGYAAFVTQIRSYASGASKPYYVTAAPQCPYPDESLGAVLNAADFDAVYVQFYNNVCGLQNYATISDWDFGIWDYWAKYVSPNPNVKIYIGAPASTTAAGTGYVSASTLGTYAVKMRQSFPSFGGVMLWDASQAYANGRYDLAIKTTLVAAGGTGFTYPACSAPAFVAGDDYTGGSQVSYDGYIWQAKWWSDNTPTNNENGDWSPISACSGGSALSTSTSSYSTSTTTTTTTTSKTTTTTSSTSTTGTTTSTSSAPSASTTSTGSCSGVATWSSSVAYTGGETVVYNGDLWTAQYWTEDDTPGGTAGVWVNDGACT
ncbi:carbohydrate-binding module family 5 protein [Jaapia argillacea MUCL 33604]|uniref:chitinase n=1 Tax=Jaapia argillacea MUCL 33604 TaxID=933084 RepID=A0A067PIN6_9AGAM|nr:carbohydrate-binding module family 5 protein [Jaapia argillacea MUCL 33604]